MREPDDLLGYIPHALGEWPEESLVAVTVGAGSVGVSVRVDLPGPLEQAALARFAETVCSHLASDPLADSAVLAVYSAAEWRKLDDPPHGETVTALQLALGDLGIPVLDAWLVGERTWRSMLCERAECCPWPGQPIESITASRVGAELVYRGSSFGPGAPSERLGASPEGLESPSRWGRLEDCPDAWWDPCTFSAALAAWDETLSTGRMPHHERLRLLAASLLRPALRDAAVVAAALGGASAWQGSRAIGVLDPWPAGSCGNLPALAGGLGAAEAGQRVRGWEERPEPGGDVDAALEFGAVILGRARNRPQWERIDRLERIMRVLVEREEPEIRAPALAVLGWIFWARGRGSKASGFLRRALSTAPGYRFADLLSRVVDGGEVAGWARSPETAWRRIGEAA
ncbi:DUF4192 family protein [Sinomonas susongensis]|uniref:DUF4192 family protein n=1 Tax=Sinomonas susongensis TaxID=1324851 RepID=UPI001486C9FF|nr:DUF4192 family protein [Sinomonas susongensis]